MAAVDARKPVGIALGAAELEAAIVVELAAEGGRESVRRCLDVVDLAARAQLAEFTAVVLDSHFPRMSAGVVDALSRTDVLVVGVALTTADHGVLRNLGISRIVAADKLDTPAVVRAIRGEIAGQESPPAPGTAESPRTVAQTSDGQLTAVWGPPGAPGRTTIATTLAQVFAANGEDTLLVDADTTTYGLAAHLALFEEPSGLTAAAHHGERGNLDASALGRLARQVQPDFRVLTGISHIGRRSELRAPTMSRLWSVARAAMDQIVVDVGHCVDDLPSAGVEGLNTEVIHTAGISAIEDADVLLAVAGCEPNSIARLLSHLPAVKALAGQVPLVVAINRLRAPVVPNAPAVRELVDFVQEQTGAASVVTVADDSATHDQAIARGLTAFEVARKSGAVSQIGQVAAAVGQGHA